MSTRSCAHCGQAIPESRRADARHCTENCTRKAWRAANPERSRQIKARYRESNRDDLRRKGRAYAAEHSEQARARYLENADRRRAQAREWARSNPDKVGDNQRRRRARKRGSTTIERVNRSAIIARDESTCYLCDRVLERDEINLDHIVPLVRGGAHAARNLAVACAPCNRRKGTRLLSEIL